MFTASHLHAMFIHFPIALLVVGFLAEVISLFMQMLVFLKQYPTSVRPHVAVVACSCRWLCSLAITNNSQGVNVTTGVSRNVYLQCDFMWVKTRRDNKESIPNETKLPTFGRLATFKTQNKNTGNFFVYYIPAKNKMDSLF